MLAVPDTSTSCCPASRKSDPRANSEPYALASPMGAAGIALMVAAPPLHGVDVHGQRAVGINGGLDAGAGGKLDRPRLGKTAGDLG